MDYSNRYRAGTALTECTGMKSLIDSQREKGWAPGPPFKHRGKTAADTATALV
jgi:hypothetical protein